MFFKLREIRNCTYDDLDLLMSKGSSHTFVINEIKDFLNPIKNPTLKDPKIAAAFKDYIKDLKLARVKSDYKNEEINSEAAEKSLRQAKEICTILKKNKI